jgi:uncharacterized protein (DUF58 family)
MSGTAMGEVARLPHDLLWVARHLASTLRLGWHRSARIGGTAEFTHLRAYRPGDELTHIDWKASARSVRVLTRVFRMTAASEVLMVLDVSPSMDWGSKLPLLRTTAAVLATLVIEQGDAAGWLMVESDLRRRLFAVRGGAFHLTGFVAGLTRLEATGTTDTATLLASAAHSLARRTTLFVLSDFYDDARMLPVMRQLTGQGHEVVAVHILTPEEQTLPATGASEYVDAETDQRVSVDHRRARTAVTQRVAAWRSGLERDVRRWGGDYVHVSTLSTLTRDLELFLRAREVRS